ncbi:MAG: peptidoglycan DD-metalloendopeptidase family protein [Oscillochloris sp.]|nr:peptidoglycan DD-metalloendopeptidase family protein [Oscillochloris sp.]
MPSLRSLRTSRSLTFLDLSHLTGIPARTIAEIEYNLCPLTWHHREQLAFVLGVPPVDILAQTLTSSARSIARPNATRFGAPALAAIALAATLATAALQDNLPQIRLPQSLVSMDTLAPVAPLDPTGSVEDRPTGSTKAVATTIENLAQRITRVVTPTEPIAPALLLRPMPDELAAPFLLTADGPVGCPLLPNQGRVVITQGYNVGSHTPTNMWGAVDLAIDGNGDGYAEPEATWYTPVLASHAGVVRVDLNTYPAGNHVWVNHSASSWRTSYSHLAVVTVISGQYVRAGEVIGMVGSTGESSGPHLDYQVWNGEVNVNPTELVRCAEGKK